MTLEERCALSYYKSIAPIDEKHNVHLVQHCETNALFVKKILAIYDKDIYLRLKQYPVRNMPKIAELAEEDNHLIVIEEYINGETLRTLLDREGTLSAQRAVSIVCQLCDILSELHGMNPPIIHRDIKPSNIMISQDGVVKLLDINAARSFDCSEERDTHLMGTVGYAAPEQYGFGSSGVTADIYGLGITLQEMLTGNHNASKPPAGKIGKVIENCTRLDPKSRYSSVQELKRALITGATPSKIVKILPPGFRSGNFMKILPALIVYALAAYVSFAMEYEENAARVFWWERIIFIILTFGTILFAGNYMGVLNKVGIAKLRNKFTRVLLIILSCVMFWALGFIIIGIFHPQTT